MSSLGRSLGDASGEGEGEEAPRSGREEDMLAVALPNVLRWLWLGRTRRQRSLVACSRCKGPARRDWQVRRFAADRWGGVVDEG
jgi:hypothetical protein